MKSRRVRIWDVQVKVSEKTKRRSYVIRWTVARKESSRAFGHRAQADNFRTELKKAANAGEEFDVETGMPDSMMPKERGMTCLELTRRYVAMKWPDAAANSRRGMLESLLLVNIALVETDPRQPDAATLRHALRDSLVPGLDPDMSADELEALKWLEEHSLPVAELGKAVVVRAALDAIGRRLDGTAAAPATRRRKRAIFYNLLEFGIELEQLEHNPIDRLRIRSRRKRVVETVDRRVVANPTQVRALLIAVASIGERIRDRGLRLVAFFGCMYFAGMRPGEVAGLRQQDCFLPDAGWGRLTLEVNQTEVGKIWTDTGRRHDKRGLKHRADKETRLVPIPTELVQLIVWHIATFGVADDGRLFRSTKGGVLGSTTYSRVWTKARELAFTPDQVRSVLAVRPYDLRHAAVSLWLNAGVPATEVANRAGQSVEVLLRIYAKCIDGDEGIMNGRIEDALG